MYPTPETCRLLAEKARAEAEETNLPQVRERLLWSAIAREDQASLERMFARLPSRNAPRMIGRSPAAQGERD